MNLVDFVGETIGNMDNSSFEMLKNDLVIDYLPFSFISTENITKEELSEKVRDFFEKVELKSGRDFDRIIDYYIKEIDSIVGSKIAKAPQPKKKEPTPVDIPRARKYYDKAMQVKNMKEPTLRDIIDYSRLMFCLYTAIIKNDYQEISDFNYSADCLNVDSIIESMKNEQDDAFLGKGKKNHFDDLRALNSLDRSTFVIALIVLHTIMNEKFQGEYYHG